MLPVPFFKTLPRWVRGGSYRGDISDIKTGLDRGLDRPSGLRRSGRLGGWAHQRRYASLDCPKPAREGPSNGHFLHRLLHGRYDGQAKLRNPWFSWSN